MNIYSKELLMSESYYTLTVVTTPADATCILAINGISYTTKTLKVKAGTVVSYSVSYSGTTTKTGSVTMDSDKTLTFTRTYSTNTTYQSWPQRTLSANGTLGGSSFAVDQSGAYTTNNMAWRAFDNNATGNISDYSQWLSNGNPSVNPQWLTFYNPVKIKVTNLKIQNRNDGFASITQGKIQGSDDNSNWIDIKSFTNSMTSSGSWNIDLSNNTNAYNYYRILVTKSTTTLCAICQITVTATQPVTSYTYYFDLTVS